MKELNDKEVKSILNRLNPDDLYRYELLQKDINNLERQVVIIENGCKEVKEEISLISKYIEETVYAENNVKKTGITVSLSEYRNIKFDAYMAENELENKLDKLKEMTKFLTSKVRELKNAKRIMHRFLTSNIGGKVLEFKKRSTTLP